jgi:hypothetical protein
MSKAGLALHPDKTRVVYCKDARRRGSHEHTSFTFLGYGFRGRRARTRSGRITTGFVPAISKDALNKISSVVRSWRLHTRTGLSETGLARRINPVVRGWMNYYRLADPVPHLVQCVAALVPDRHQERLGVHAVHLGELRRRARQAVADQVDQVAEVLDLRPLAKLGQVLQGQRVQRQNVAKERHVSRVRPDHIQPHQGA